MTLDEFFNYATRLSVTESLNEKPDLTEYELAQWSNRYYKMFANQDKAPNNLFSWPKLNTLIRYVHHWRSATALEFDKVV